MKTIKYILLILLILPLLNSCDKNEINSLFADRITVTVSLQNSSGATGCAATVEVTFIVSYRDIQVDVTVNPGSIGIINVLVEDRESINVIVQRTSDNTVLSNANVNVRTESRPDNLEGITRKASYCRNSDLIFTNF